MTTIEQFEAQLSGLGENLSNLQTILTEIAGRVVDDMKDNAPYDTGDLKASIKAIVDKDSIKFTMLDYGLFQNYGVDGTDQSVAEDVPKYGIEPRPKNGDTYRFSKDSSFGTGKTIYELGLKPQKFFDLDEISETISTYVADRLIQNNNL